MGGFSRHHNARFIWFVCFFCDNKYYAMQAVRVQFSLPPRIYRLPYLCFCSSVFVYECKHISFIGVARFLYRVRILYMHVMRQRRFSHANDLLHFARGERFFCCLKNFAHQSLPVYNLLTTWCSSNEYSQSYEFSATNRSELLSVTTLLCYIHCCTNACEFSLVMMKQKVERIPNRQ